MTNNTIKAKNKKTGEIKEFRRTTNFYNSEEFGYLCNNDLNYYFENDFNDLFEVVDESELEAVEESINNNTVGYESIKKDDNSMLKSPSKPSWEPEMTYIGHSEPGSDIIIPPSWEERFENHLKELNHDDNYEPISGDTESHYFGFKHLTNDRWVYTIADWGNIKSFIAQTLREERERMIKYAEVKRYTFNVVDWEDGIQSIEPIEDETKSLSYAQGYNQACEDIINLIKSHEKN